MSVLAEVRHRWWLALLGVALLVLLLGSRVATFYTDALWFRSVGFEEVFWGLLGTQVGLGVATGLAMTALLGANLLLAKRLSPPYRIPSPQEEAVERYRQAVEPYARLLLLGLAVGVGLLSGLSLAGEWPTYLLWANAVEFGRLDPHFGRDLGWFVFVLPFHRLANSWLFTSLALTIVLTAVAHYLFGGIRPQSPGQKITPQINVHLSSLLAALVAVRAWGFVLDRYMLSYSERGTVTGLSYTDVHAQLRAYEFLAVIAVVCVGLFLVNIRIRGWLLPSAGVGILLVAALVLSGVYPAVIQRLRVEPQELAREAPYIERNLDSTRFAYGLDVDSQGFPAEAQLTAEQVSENRATLESVRLWDPATLQATYQQLQAFRPYYDFLDVDVDRYPIEREQAQVMLAVRELDERTIPQQARTWQNRRMVYTHGYGIVSSSVSGATRQGLPLFLASNIDPLDAEPALDVDNPRIYFGENPPPYSIVNGRVEELDYPREGSSFETNRYEGRDGVGVGSPLRRLAFAFRFGDPNIVLSSLIQPDSRILFNRQVRDRVRLVAPFLKLDHDPYPVAVDGRIKWIVDGYTVSDMLPYSQRVELGDLTNVDQRVFRPVQQPDGAVTLRETTQQLPAIQGRANYIRNSVKAVVDAFDGTVTLYLVDPDDPVIRAWRRVFPRSFTDLEEASEGLRAHFRYPEDMFRVQAALYRTYHMRGPAEFYAKEDAWEIPPDASFIANRDNPTPAERNKPLRPYYLLMRLPGEADEEFALIQPFTPSGEQRNNLIGYLAGRSDPGVYGQLKAYTFPPNRTIFGPRQVQARIDQDGAVSEQITFWNQSGSRVTRGNLLVIPVADSLLYVEPLFLQAEQSSIPELKKIVLVFGDSVVMRDTLAQGLEELFAVGAGQVRPPGEGPGGERPADEPGGADAGVSPQVADLIRQALERFSEAERALRAGDLGGYQRATREAQGLLEEAQRLTGGPSPPAPGPSPEAQPGPEPTPGARPAT
ncbi:MAG: UPF0182 family protein [Actinomycetota bacterium]|nr:UPF0182 family protein [Actinomycetota bacterium]